MKYLTPQISTETKEKAISFIQQADGFDIDTLQKIKQDFEVLSPMLYEAVNQLDISLSATQHWQLLKYLDTLLFWNKTYNLTAITQPTEALVKHVIDCLAILPTLNTVNSDKQYNLATTDMLDIGAGAGLPSIIVAICQPERVCTPLDSNQKKIRFIRQVSSELELQNAQPVASRIENFEGKFQLITSRAFSSLQDFIELATPYLSDTGKLLAMKGKAPTEEELDSLSANWQIEVIPITVPYLSDTRHLVKLSQLN